MNTIFTMLLVVVILVTISTAVRIIEKFGLLLLLLIVVVFTTTTVKGGTMTNLERRALEAQGLTPELNDAIRYGISYMQHRDSLQYMETVAHNVCVAGMEFEGVKVPTPMEHYRKTIQGGKVAEVRLDQTDMYPIELKFKYRDNPFTVYPYIIDVGIGNLTTINGTRLVIKPIITSIFTGTNKGVLVKTLSNKATIRSLPRLLHIQDGKGNEKITEVGMCHCEHLPNTMTIPTAIHIIYQYGLAKFGIKIIRMEDWDGKSEMITNQAQSPNQLGVIIDKKVVKTTEDYEESVRIAAGLLYLSIVHSDTLLSLDGTNTQSVFATIHQMRINGKSTRKGDEIVLNKTIKEIEAIKFDTISQIASLGDPITIDRLKVEGIVVENYTDILRWVSNNYSSQYIIGKTSSIFLDSIYYTLYNISSALYKGTKQLNATGNQSHAVHRTGFRTDNLDKRFRSVNKNGVYGLAGAKKNLTIEALKGAGDNKYYLATSLMDDQNRGDGVQAASRANSQFNSGVVRAGHMDLGDIHWATKSYNSPTARLNLCAKVIQCNGYKVIERDPNQNKLLNRLLEG